MSYEDFTTWTESDALNRLSQTADRSSFTGLLRSDDRIYLYRDYGVGFFKAWTHWLDIYIDSIYHSGELYRASLICYTDYLDDWQGNKNAGREQLGVLVRTGTGGGYFRLTLFETPGNNKVHSTSQFLIDTPYYLEVYKSGTTARVKVYSDAGRTVLLETLNLTLGADRDFRYLMCPQSYDDAQAYEVSGWCEYLCLSDGLCVTPAYEGRLEASISAAGTGLHSSIDAVIPRGRVTTKPLVARIVT